MSVSFVEKRLFTKYFLWSRSFHGALLLSFTKKKQPFKEIQMVIGTNLGFSSGRENGRFANNISVHLGSTCSKDISLAHSVSDLFLNPVDVSQPRNTIG